MRSRFYQNLTKQNKREGELGLNLGLPDDITPRHAQVNFFILVLTSHNIFDQLTEVSSNSTIIQIEKL